MIKFHTFWCGILALMSCTGFERRRKIFSRKFCEPVPRQKFFDGKIFSRGQIPSRPPMEKARQLSGLLNFNLEKFYKLLKIIIITARSDAP